jgi:hypothetical protein
MRMVGEHIMSSDARTDPILAIEKEKEGKFDMEAEEAAIAAQMQAINQAMGVPTNADKPQVIKDKKKKRR